MSQAHIDDYAGKNESKPIALDGCTPETLLDYLKSLGLFKVVSEQLDSDARSYWENDIFHIMTKENKESMIEFFMYEYEPLPVVVPWSGSDFFGVDETKEVKPQKKPPTDTELIKAYLSNGSDRLERYNTSVRKVLEIIDEMDITKKDINASSKEGKATKVEFINRLRSSLPGSMVDFLDVATKTGTEEIFMNTLLGSGGGNDGRLNFGSNYMQCVWLCLPDFDEQKDLKGNYRGFDSEESLTTSLFKEGERGYISSDSPGLFSPGGVGGPNAFEGFEAESLRNPWDFILAMEGITLLAGSLSRRHGSQASERASFPFTCRLSPSGSESLLLSERSNREIWMPLWEDKVKINGLTTVFREGRAEVSGRFAEDGLDFAKAVASLGVDRGISKFKRFGIIKGRVGGDNYHSGAKLDTIEVPDSPREHIHLLDDLNDWLERIDWSFSNDSIAERYKRHKVKIEDAIFNYCKYGGTLRLQAILRAAGKAEKAFASASGDGRPRPLHDMSPSWISACNDNSVEYRLACSLASIYDPKVGPIRVQMEPVEWNKKNIFFNKWQSDKRATVWGNRQVSKNLSVILERRLMEGERSDCTYPPIDGMIRASLHDINRFISGDFDESKLIDLLWGLSTIRWYEYDSDKHRPDFSNERTKQISRPYCILKMIFLPYNIDYKKGENGRWESNYDDSGYLVKPEPSVLRLVQGERFGEAFERCSRRLKATGLQMKTSTTPDFAVPPEQKDRLIASLLFPVWEIDKIARYVVKEPKIDE